MAVFQAICTKCGKSINLRKTQTDEYVCPFCGQSFTYAELQAAGDVVDVDKAKADYGRAQHYFSVGDYGALAVRARLFHRSKQFLRGIFLSALRRTFGSGRGQDKRCR